MADRRFYVRSNVARLGDILQGGPATIDINANLQQSFADVSRLELAGPEDICFVGDDISYKDMAAQSKAGLFIVSAKSLEWLSSDAQFILCSNPAGLFNYIVGRLYQDLASGIVGYFDPKNNIAASAKIDPSAEIAPNAVIGDYAEIGARTKVGPFVSIGHGVKIGRDCLIHSHVSVAYSLMGDKVQISSGTRVGVDGFGLIEGKSHEKVLHIGRVIIQDSVDIGANCAIDRGTYGDTVIGEGSKIDNLVQVAHNTQIGRHVRAAGQTGLAGSCRIDDYAVLAGGAGVGNGGHVGAHAIVAARAAVFGKVPDGEVYAGIPARPLKEWQKQNAFVAQLYKKFLRDKGRG